MIPASAIVDDHALAWALHLAAAQGDAAAVRRAVVEAPWVAAATDDHSRTVLHNATLAGDAAVVAALLEVAPHLADIRIEPRAGA